VRRAGAPQGRPQESSPRNVEASVVTQSIYSTALDLPAEPVPQTMRAPAITHRLPLEEFTTAFELLESGEAGKVVLSVEG